MPSQEQMNDIANLYAGYFDRAPDPAGLQFWFEQIDAGREFATIAADFAKSAEALALYPFLSTPDVASSATFVTAIYQNLFGRAPDADGLKFWTDVIEAKTVSIGDMIQFIINGAVDAPDATPPTFDAAVLENKAIVGLDFAAKAADATGFTYDAAAAAAAKAVMDGVTNDAASVDAAKAVTDAFIGGVSTIGETISLTTAVGENVLGTAGDDTFSGTVDAAGLGNGATINPTDKVDGAGGTDTINIVSTSGAAPVAASLTKNIEIVNLISDVPANTFVAGAANVANYAGVQQLWQIGGAASIAVTGVTNAVTVGFNDTVVNNVAMASGATTANIALSDAASGGTIIITEATADKLTTVSVSGNVVGGGTLDIDTTATTSEETLKVALTSDTTVNLTSGSNITIDASKSTGDLTIVGVATTETMTGGTGDDALTGGGATTLLDGGVGDDTLDASASTGAVTILGGAGVDTITSGANDSTVTGGTGADDMTAGAGADTFIIDSGDSGIKLATADLISGFMVADDALDFNLAAGTADNFLNGGISSSFTDALTNANTSFDGTVQYFVSTDGIANTFVFVDADLDGTADMAVNLAGAGIALTFDNIIA